MTALEGKSAIVTGAGRGIGAAIAARLAADGAAVAAVDLVLDGAETTAKAIEAAGGRALAIAADVSSADDAESVMDRVEAEFGSIGILVNNAGVTRDNLLFKMSEDDWDTVLDVNLKSVFLMARAAQKRMVPARSGKIVNLSSVSALGNRGQANYAAAKAGVQGLTATLAAELGPYGINVNAVAPGYVATPMTDATAARLGMTVEQAHEAAAAAIPLRRVAQPEDIANVIAFLVSEDAAYVTGQTLYVNGGLR
ncbi:MAG: Dehydrogenase with different specificity (related to short-chain alcohol dehydrogenase)-like [Actinomycetia bacterium]|nr:Dehydrogenase with different specificity (related to short-chain alcohol dehydrogenase)-like [Actinomycetes bacterium]MDQ1652293.1 3-oxoacyl-[acyl-carrier protein] reductase [Cryptosporangiaceae bacterium]